MTLSTRIARGVLCLALLGLGAVPASTAPAWDAFTRAWSGIAGYSATVTVFEQKGTQSQRMLLDYTFHKPANATVHIVEGPNSGVTLVWNGGSTLQAHRGSGVAALFKKTFQLGDPLATTIRGSSIDQLSFDAILVHAQQTSGMLSQVPGLAIGGVATDEVRLVPATPESDGLTLEVVDVSSVTDLPVRVFGFEGPVLVRDVEFSDVKLETRGAVRP